MARTSANALTAYSVLVFTPLFFSSNLIIGRAAVDAVGPWTLAFWRWSIAFLLILPFAAPAIARNRAVIVAMWREVALLGFLGMWICGGIVYLSLHYTTATNATLIYTASPVFVVILEIIFRGEPASGRRVLGIAMAVLGVFAILLRGDLARLLTLEMNAGDLGFAAAAFSWAVYSVILRRAPLAAIPTAAMFAATAFAGAVLLAPMMLWETVTAGYPAGRHAWASILAAALVPSLLAYSSYQYGVKTLGPTVTSIFLYLMPVYGVGLAVVFLGEELRPYHGAGMLLVTAGVVLATTPRETLGRLCRRSAD